MNEDLITLATIVKPKSDKSMKIAGQTIYFKSSENIDKKEIDGLTSFIITSPPYWDLKKYGHSDEVGQEDYETYLKRLNAIWEKCYDVSTDNALLCIVVNDRRKEKVFYPIPMDIARNMKRWKLIDYMIWYSPNAMTQNGLYKNKLYDKKSEMILLFAKNYEYNHTFNKIRVKQKYLGIDPRSHNKDKLGRGIPNIIRCPAHKTPLIKNKNYHIAAFPDRLIYALIHTFSNEKDIVLDPFLGSGTVLKIAKHMKRTGYGYEINSTYRDLIENKIMEPFFPPKWEELDILHEPEAISKINTNKPRDEKKKSSS